jgi:hypothetical protein
MLKYFTIHVLKIGKKRIKRKKINSERKFIKSHKFY